MLVLIMGLVLLPWWASAVAPVAYNQSASVVEAVETMVSFEWSDVDTPALTSHTFTVTSNPRGRLESYASRSGGDLRFPNFFYYRAPVGPGPDIFTWKCNDGANDSNIATYTITVQTNTRPVAGSMFDTRPSNEKRHCIPQVTDPDGQDLFTFSVLSFPAHGRLEYSLNDQYAWFYRSEPGYVGPDSFTWKCNDGINDSNIGTNNFDIYAYAPLPEAQSVGVMKDTMIEFVPSYSYGGYPMSFAKVSGPGKGTLIITNNMFRYTPNAGYEGADSFTWRITYDPGSGPVNTATVTCSLSVEAGTTDWPTFRANAYRTGISVASLPETLHLQWRRDLPEVRQAWPSDRTDGQWISGKSANSMGIDLNYEPVAADGKVFVGSDRDDCVRAYDAATGAELWCAYTEGPIRMAPLYDNGLVFAGSDDSFVYCWNANTGALLWKKQMVAGGGATLRARKKAFGNQRLISSWPVRGGLMMVDDKLYFASGLWPMEGAFVGALDPATGATLWMYDGSMSPQGYLVRTKLRAQRDDFYVPAGRSIPQRFFLHSGLFRDGSGVGTEGSRAAHTWVVFNNLEYTGLNEWPVAITVGAKMYSESDVTVLGAVGTVARIIAANGRLFVVTRGASWTTGIPQSLYCFSGDAPATNVWPLVVTPLASSNDVWKTRATRILAESAVSDKGVALLLGIGSGRLMDELLLQSSLHIVAVDPDTNKVQALRLKLSNAGLHGTRASVLAGHPLECGLPPYLARLIVSEDITAAGWTNGVGFVQGVYRSLRPYDGKAWLFASDNEYTMFAGWVGAAGLTNATVAPDSSNEFAVLTRMGALPGAAEWTAANGTVTNVDRVIQGPLGVLWYGDTFRDIAGGGHWQNTTPDLVTGRVVGYSGRSIDAYSGLILSGLQAYSGGTKTMGVELKPGLIEDSPWLQRRNPLFGLRERNYPSTSAAGEGFGGCGDLTKSYGRIRSPASIYAHEMGLLEMPFKARCGADGMIPANGMLVVAQEDGCGCTRALQTAAALVNDPDAENWVGYSVQRLGQTVEDVPIMRLGVNFGAPNEHMGTDGKLWLHQPRSWGLVRATEWFYSVPFEPWTARSYYHNSMRMLSSEGPKWVSASGLEGVTKIRIPLAWPTVANWNVAGPAPVADGNLSEACWDGANPVLLSYESAVKQGVPEGVNPLRRASLHEGQVWFRYDATNIYIGARLNNPGSATDATSRGWNVYLSDRSKVSSVGVWKYLALRLNRLGVKSGNQGKLSGDAWTVPNVSESTWNGAWDGALVWSGTNTCTVEMVVPWTTLAAEGLDRERLLINVSGPKYANIRGDWSQGRGWDGNTGFTFVPLYYDAAPGLIGGVRPYMVKLHFAETEGALGGTRVFDVKLQGCQVLTNFDIFAAAGGADRGIVRAFSGVQIGDELVLELVPKTGLPIISGAELEAEFTLPNQAPVLLPRPDLIHAMAAGSSREFNLNSETLEPDGDALTYTWELDGVKITNGITAGAPVAGSPTWMLTRWTYAPKEANVGEHRVRVTANDGRGGETPVEWKVLVTGVNSLPVATAAASRQVGTAPLAVTFDASGSADANGTIVSYAWDYGDGSTGSGVSANHTFTQTGSYSVRLTVTDNGGASNSTNVMLYAIASPLAAAPQIDSALTVTGVVGLAFSYTITASGTTPITYDTGSLPAWLSFNGTMLSGTPLASGTYNLTLTAINTYGGATNTLALVMVDQTLTAITVSPSSAGVMTNGTQIFSASARDQFGTAMASQPIFDWTVTGGGLINAAGLFTAEAVAGGPYTVTAAGGGKSGSASVTVTANPAPTVMADATATPNPASGATTTLSVLGADNGGEANLTYTWTAAGTPPAPVTFSINGNNAAKQVTAIFTQAGSYTLQVAIMDAGSLAVTSSVPVTVSQTLTSLDVTPASAGVTVGGTQVFTAVGRDQFGTALTSPPVFTWTVSGGGTINAAGLFTAGGIVGGPYTVTASSAGRNGTAVVSVNSAPVAPPRTDVNSIPYAESFENLTAWGGVYTNVYITNGWYTSDAAVDRSMIAGQAYAYSGILPLSSAAHTNILRLDSQGAVLSNVLTDATFDTARIYVDAMVRMVASEELPVICTTVDTGRKAVVFANASSNLMIYHGVLDAGTGLASNTVDAMANIPRLDATNWYRLTVVFDHAANAVFGLDMFQVQLDRVIATNEHAYAADWKTEVLAGRRPVTSAQGTWFLSATRRGVSNTLSRLAFQGAGFLDDLTISRTDPFFVPPSFFTITQHIGLHGQADPPDTFTLPGGASTTILYTASPWFRIQSLTTDGVSVAAAAGARTYTQSLVAVQADATNNVTFVNATAVQAGIDTNVSTTWAAAYFATEAAAAADGNLALDYLLGQLPSSSYTSVLTIRSIAVASTNVNVMVGLSGAGLTLPTTIHGTLKLRCSGNLAAWTDVGAIRIDNATFDAGGNSAVIAFTTTASNTFYKAEISP